MHDLLATAPRRWRFTLTGSSARRLRREDVNLLGGRVVTAPHAALTLADGPVRVLPVHAFARELAAGRVLRER